MKWLKVSKSQKHFFFNLHCPWSQGRILSTFSLIFWVWSFQKNAFKIYWPLTKSEKSKEKLLKLVTRNGSPAEGHPPVANSLWLLNARKNHCSVRAKVSYISGIMWFCISTKKYFNLVFYSSYFLKKILKSHRLLENVGIHLNTSFDQIKWFLIFVIQL